MTPRLASFAMPLMMGIDPERAHRLALLALRLGMAGHAAPDRFARLRFQAMGLNFPNPVGLAAGFDKDATAVRPLRRLGFGFIEVGSVTPLPQSGNPLPRLFRLVEDGAAINRYGLNSQGVERFVARLRAAPAGVAPLGANIGINKEGGDPERDYPTLIRRVSPFVDYVALNVSSPNTPGLRDLQAVSRLDSILDAVAINAAGHPPLLVKIAPDLSDEALADIVQLALRRSVAGLIVANTTVARPASLTSAHRGQAGGLSGKPLFVPSTRLLADIRRQAGRDLVLVGCGGIASPRDALTKLKAGANLVQFYTAFAYAGPALVPHLLSGLDCLLRKEGFQNVTEAVGADL
jgi:dihydroorotate dehydrogenase